MKLSPRSSGGQRHAIGRARSLLPPGSLGEKGRSAPKPPRIMGVVAPTSKT